MRFFHTSHHSGSDDGLWTAIDGMRVAVINFEHWENLDSSAVATHGRYNIRCGWVNLERGKERVSALQSCGWEFVGEDRANHTVTFEGCHPLDILCPHTGDIVARYSDRRTWKLCLTEAMWGHGAYEFLEDISGNNRAQLFKAARANF